MPTDPFPTYDDEIDLRAIVLPLWRARNLVLIVTLAAAIAAFVISFWILPRKYQASAYVFIGKPALNTSYETASGLTVSPIVPDLEEVVIMSTAPGLLESVHSDPVVAAAIGNEEIALVDMATADTVGEYQLSLQITDTDPQRAALLANTWAEKVTAKVNASYGLGAFAQSLDSQVLQSQQNYFQDQAVLEEALSQIPVDALNLQSSFKQGDLENSKAQLVEFTMKRDQSQGTYFELVQLQQQVTTLLANYPKIASVSREASPPANQSSPNVKWNTLLAGMLGFMLSAFWVLAAEWWKNSNETQDAGQDMSRM